MKYLRNIAVIFIFLAFGLGIFAATLPIDQYTQAISVFTGTPNISSLQKRRLLNKAECTVEPDGDTFLLSPNCLLVPIQGGLLDWEVLDELMPYVSGIPNVYNISSTNFQYEATKPIFTKRIFPVTIGDPIDYAFLLDLQKQGTRIRVSKLQLAYLINKNWSRYGVWKPDVGNLLSCTKQNYYVAFNSLSDYIWYPDTELNLNDIIKYRAGYCKGSGPKDLMFYGGVCGFATQVFRLSLLIPNVDAVERYGHSMRYVPYYSEYIFGDDAALYQNQKKLILKNNLNVPIYFKTIDQGNSTYLIGVVPKQMSSYVEIQRQQIDNLQGQVTKTIKTPSGESRIEKTMTTSYTKRTYTMR